LITLKKKSLNSKKKEKSKIKSDEAIKQKTEKNYQTTETKIINQKIQKIKSAFPKSILDKNPKIADKLNSLD
jgi:hypothetical protein